MSYKGLNATRLGEALLKSESTPDNIKEKVGRKMRSSFAKEFIGKLDLAKRRTSVSTESSELLQKQKACKVDGHASAKADERDESLEKYIVRDPPMPTELYDMCLYFMSVFFIMCRIPFVVAGNSYFLKFLKALRPNFVKRLPVDVRFAQPRAGPHTSRATEC